MAIGKVLAVKLLPGWPGVSPELVPESVRPLTLVWRPKTSVEQ